MLNGNGKWLNGRLTTTVLIVGLLGNAVFFGIKAGETGTRLSEVEKKQQAMEDIKERVVRLETIAEQTSKTVDSIDRKLDRLMGRK